MNLNVLRRWCDPKEILIVANNFDEDSLVFHAIRQARKGPARVHLAELAPHTMTPSTLQGEDLSVCLKPLARPGPLDLEQVAARLAWAGIRCVRAEICSMSADVISNYAKSREIDRIIISEPTGRTTTPESLGEDLMQVMDLPVCVIGRHSVGDSHRERLAQRVTAALFLESDNEMYLRFASRFAQEQHAHLTLFHVFKSIEPPSPTRQYTSVVMAAHLPPSTLREAEMLCSLELVVRQGHPAREILAYNAHTDSDFIIMGAPRHSLDAGHVADATLRTVISEARCPVLVLPRPVQIEKNRLSDEPVAELASFGW